MWVKRNLWKKKKKIQNPPPLFLLTLPPSSFIIPRASLRFEKLNFSINLWKLSIIIPVFFASKWRPNDTPPTLQVWRFESAGLPGGCLPYTKLNGRRGGGVTVKIQKNLNEENSIKSVGKASLQKKTKPKPVASHKAKPLRNVWRLKN